MTDPKTILASMALPFLPFALHCSAQSPVSNEDSEPAIVDLGNQRYRIGSIVIDKAAGSFQVPGRVLREAPPIEFLVTTKGGYKSYESVLEADASAHEFNLACILIGLDAGNATTLERRAQGEPLEGDAVEITISWTEAGKTISVPGSRLLIHGDPPRPVSLDDWIYTGSVTLPDGQYLAEVTGTLLGVVHRGESVIELKQGVGVGDYGSVLVNAAALPETGAAVDIFISNKRASK